MNKFIGIRRAFSIGLTSIIFLTSPSISLAQQKIMGVLTVSGTVRSGEANFITINGERAVSGQSVLSPAEIATPPQTNARITISKIGQVEFGPNSRMNLTFEENRLAGVFTEGLLTLDVPSDTSISIQTLDGMVTSSREKQGNVIFKVDYFEGKARVTTIKGVVLLNGALVAAGQILGGGAAGAGSSTSTAAGGGAGGAGGAAGAGGGILGSTIGVTVAVVAGVVAATVAAVTVANSNQDEVPVSPMR